MDFALNIKLSDFGFARGHMKPKNGMYALSETFCGSYAYASPEILKGVPYRPQDSDIWSMGVVLYAIVYGRLPFDDTNYTQLLKVNRNLFIISASETPLLDIGLSQSLPLRSTVGGLHPAASCYFLQVIRPLCG